MTNADILLEKAGFVKCDSGNSYLRYTLYGNERISLYICAGSDYEDSDCEFQIDIEGSSLGKCAVIALNLSQEQLEAILAKMKEYEAEWRK